MALVAALVLVCGVVTVLRALDLRGCAFWLCWMMVGAGVVLLVLLFGSGMWKMG